MQKLENKAKATAENAEESLMQYSELVEYKKDYIESLKKPEKIILNLSQEKQDLSIKIEKFNQEIYEIDEKLRNKRDQDNLRSKLLNTE
jgi:hypothetical protein